MVSSFGSWSSGSRFHPHHRLIFLLFSPYGYITNYYLLPWNTYFTFIFCFQLVYAFCLFMWYIQMLLRGECNCAESHWYCDHPTRAEVVDVCRRVDGLICRQGRQMRSRARLGRFLHRNGVGDHKHDSRRLAKLWIRHGMGGILDIEWARVDGRSDLVYRSFKCLLEYKLN